LPGIRIGSEIPGMIAQNGTMAVMVAGTGRAAGWRTPVIEGFPIVPAFAGDRGRSHRSEGAASDATAPCVAIAMSRIDPAAETRRGAGCTAELDVPNLAYASLVCSTIAKGRVVEIDAGAALLVNGVISILTHQNLPDIVDDQACEDEAIPSGSHFRLLQDKEIMFKGQPVALVVARTPEIACFAASLVRVEYETYIHVADVHPQRDATTEYDDPMELGASTAIFESRFRISIRDTIQGAQGLRQYFRSRFGRGLRPQLQAILAVRAALALQCSVRVVLTLQQMRDFACAPRQVCRSR
jgi:xanthine dehydrogenase YagR molybdenum-binding subunit